MSQPEGAGNKTKTTSRNHLFFPFPLKRNRSEPTMTSSNNSDKKSFNLSFRFSPDSEEIQEVNNEEEVPPSPSPSSTNSSLHSTPSSSSKLKSTKLKSLSLDLDFKSKLRAAFSEGFSNFIPEETPSPIVTVPVSKSIPENLTSFCEEVKEDSNFEDKRRSPIIEEDAGLVDEFEDEDFDFKTPPPHLFQDFIKIEALERMELFRLDSDESTMDSADFYHPSPKLNSYPCTPTLAPLVAEEGGGRPLRRGSAQSCSEPSGSGPGPPPPPPERNPLLIEDMKISTLIINILSSIVFHKGSKYLIAILAFNMTLQIPYLTSFLYFLAGALFIHIINNALFSAHAHAEELAAAAASMASAPPVPEIFEIEGSKLTTTSLVPPPNAQGFLLLLDIAYSPETCHFRMTKPVFVRLDQRRLFVSYPSKQMRVPKRRLWSDPVIPKPYTFSKVKVYNLTNAVVELKPLGLAKNRIWNRKYPITITFPQFSVYYNVCEEGGGEASSKHNGIAYSASSDDVSLTKRKKKEISRIDCSLKTIYIFARCDREKEDWFRRFVTASRQEAPLSDYLRRSPDPASVFRDYMKKACPTILPYTISLDESYDTVDGKSESSEYNSSNNQDKDKTPTKKGGNTTPSTSKSPSPNADLSLMTAWINPTFLNALLARLFFDFLKSPHYRGVVQSLIDKKLFFLKKPFFMEHVTVKELELGGGLPKIIKASSPILTHQGLTIDLEIAYDGKFSVTVETFFNVYNEKVPKSSIMEVSPVRQSMYDPEADDSGESSDDEDNDLKKLITNIHEESAAANNSTSANTRTTKFAKLQEKIVNSPLMHTGIVRKFVNHITSSTPLLLTIELQSCHGILTLNVPNAPSDRVWIGFKSNPEIKLDARPKLGETSVNINHLLTWLKNKILLEIQRAVVCPNMVDVGIGLMDFEIPT